jgi:hypothetical protein
MKIPFVGLSSLERNTSDYSAAAASGAGLKDDRNLAPHKLRFVAARRVGELRRTQKQETSHAPAEQRASTSLD